MIFFKNNCLRTLSLCLMMWCGGMLVAQSDQFGVAHSPEKTGAGLVVVDFAASWCKPCLKSLPKLQELARKNTKSQFLVICVDETRTGWEKLIKRTGVTFPVVWDEHHTWAEHYAPKGMPALFILDEKGNILYSHVGFNREKWNHFLRKFQELEGRN